MTICTVSSHNPGDIHTSLETIGGIVHFSPIKPVSSRSSLSAALSNDSLTSMIPAGNSIVEVPTGGLIKLKKERR